MLVNGSTDDDEVMLNDINNVLRCQLTFRDKF